MDKSQVIRIFRVACGTLFALISEEDLYVNSWNPADPGNSLGYLQGLQELADQLDIPLFIHSETNFRLPSWRRTLSSGAILSAEGGGWSHIHPSF